MRALADWLGLSFDESRLLDFQTEERWSGMDNVGIQQRGTDWESDTLKKDVTSIERVCFDEMKIANYLPRYATDVRRPGASALTFATLGDAWRVLNVYAKERGWPRAITYKVRQWRASKPR